ncbi:MAG TPA: hypothetical protein VJR94_07450 [Candidatus Nitrosocosmicus sp.]|nr:hypothetical protein [Candidatus Nitrosocosmicus sp.]
MNDNLPTTNSVMETSPIKKARFYFIYEHDDLFELIDKTKRGLEIKDKLIDEKTGIESVRGMIYDMEGTGHRVTIRWLYPKSRYNLNQVIEDAERMEKRYREIREMTCPDDD